MLLRKLAAAKANMHLCGTAAAANAMLQLAKTGICVGLSVRRKSHADNERAFTWDYQSAAKYMDFAWDYSPR